MLRGQINVYLTPEHPIIAIRNNRNQNGRRIGKKVYRAFSHDVTAVMLVFQNTEMAINCV